MHIPPSRQFAGRRGNEQGSEESTGLENTIGSSDQGRGLGILRGIKIEVTSWRYKIALESRR